MGGDKRSPLTFPTEALDFMALRFYKRVRLVRHKLVTMTQLNFQNEINLYLFQQFLFKILDSQFRFATFKNKK